VGSPRHSTGRPVV